MTREEAIAVLENEARIIDDNSIEMTVREWDEFDDLKREAIPMAIEALSADAPSGDLISRQAAMSAIYNIGTYMGRKDAMDTLKALPSADCDTCIYNVCNYNRVPWESNGELIDRQAAVNVVHKYFVGLYNDEPYATDEDGDEVFTDMKSVNALLKHNNEVSKAIKALPSADREDYEKGYKDGQLAVMIGNDEKEFERGYRMGQAADRPTGEWEHYIDRNGIPWERCSECGDSTLSVDRENMNFCPNCGADMRGADDE